MFWFCVTHCKSEYSYKDQIILKSSFKVVGYLTYENQTVSAWSRIFEICGGCMIVSGIIYILFNDGSLQPWNKPKNDMKIQMEELRTQVLANKYEVIRKNPIDGYSREDEKKIVE
jgi:hypothetical protein